MTRRSALPALAMSMALSAFAGAGLAETPLQPADLDLPAAPEPIKRAYPRFPPGAFESHIYGRAEVAVTVDDAGAAADVSVLREYPKGAGFGRAAVTAVAQYVFEPHRAGRYKVTISFYPDDSEPAAPHYALMTPNEGTPPLAPAPAPVKWSAPVYPAMSLEWGTEGSVTLVAQLEAGRAVTLGILNDPPKGLGRDDLALLGDAAARAVEGWEFPSDTTGVYGVTVVFSKAELASGRLARPDG